MKAHMNPKTLYLVALSLVLLTILLTFSFFFLIPKGKEYRTLRLENKKEEKLLIDARKQYDKTQSEFQKLEETHVKTIKGFKNAFNPDKFARIHRKEFQELVISEIHLSDQNGSFKIYEVNATTKISSPESFYHFLENVNHSDWIIGVDFPIHFEREGELIKSSFTMKVHHFSEVKEEIQEASKISTPHPTVETLHNEATHNDHH